MRNLSRGSGGFTLLELMVAAALATVAATVVVLVLSRGMAAWQRADGRLQAFFVMEKGLSRIRDDLHNAVLVSDQPFEGLSDQIAFLTAESFTQLMGVQYRLESRGEQVVLIREQTLFPEETDSVPQVQTVAKRVQRFSIEYGYRGQTPGETIFLDVWEPDAVLPRILRVNLEVEDAKGRLHEAFRDVWLPHGVWVQPEAAAS